MIAYLHNHYWEADPSATPAWQRAYARQCIDAGAAIFVAHGPPLLQGIERYKGTLLLHGLGSAIFQTRKAAGSYGPEAWQSAIVDARLNGHTFVAATLTPVQLDGTRSAPDAEFTRGTPTIARGRVAAGICSEIVRLSAAMGCSLDHDGETIAL